MADRTVKVSLQAQVTGYLAGMEKARKATADTGTAAEKAAKQAEDHARAMQSAGKGLMAVGLVAVAATALSVKAAIGWESAWAGVTKTVSGTPAELSKVEEGLRSLAKTLPASHDEIAAVAEAAGQLGIQTGSVTAFTRTMIDLGETTNLSADQAATSLARFMNVMGTSQDDVGRLGSTVVALGNNFATTESEIVDMSMRLAGAGRQIGLSEGQVLGLSTALSSVGIEAEAGGSAISKVMIDIASEVANGGDKLELFAKTSGMSAKDFSAQWKSDPGAALAGFVKGLSEAESQGGSTLNILEELGITEVRMRDALLRSASASDLFTKAMKDGDQAFEDNNALAEEAAKRYATVESQLQIMGNRVTDAAISFGQVFLPAVSGAAEVVGGFADMLGSMDPVLQGVVASVGLVGGAVALAGGGFLLAIPKIAAYQVALVTLSTSSLPAVARAAVGMMSATTKAGAAMAATAKFMTGPWGVALAAGVVGVTLLTKYIDSLKATSEEMTNALKTAASAQDLFATAAQGAPIETYDLSLKSLTRDLELLGDAQGNTWAQFGAEFQNANIPRLQTILGSMGDELGALAGSDLPSAQNAFRELAKAGGGTEEAMSTLLDAMPEYKDALTKQASALGINVTSSDEAANKTALLELAFGDATPVALSAADAYLAAADEAAGLDDEILSLIASMNELNGVGQDASSANIAYQQSLDDLDAQIAKIDKGTKGYKRTLDIGTDAGRENRAMLDDLAASNQAAAEKQFELDGNTANYKKTLEDGRKAVYDRARALGANADEANRIADEISKIPNETAWKVIADTAAARNTINNFISSVNGRRINLIVDGQVGRKVGGSQVIDAARAHGGILPGAPSSVDNMIIRAATGEFVTNAKSTADPDNRRALEFMNNGGTIRGYANGGQVGYASAVQYVPSGPSGGGSAAVNVSPRVSLAGATFAISIEGRQMTAVIQEQIVTASNANASQIRRGKQ